MISFQSELFDKGYYARMLVGLPFQHQGRNIRGIDCVGVVTHVCDRMGVPYNDPRNYPRNGNSHMLLRYTMESFLPCEEFEADVVLLRYKGEYPEHIGVCVGNSVIHAHALYRKVVEESLHTLRPFVHSFWRFKK